MVQLEIGKIYKFNYESSSSSKKKDYTDYVKTVVNVVEKNNIIEKYTHPDYVKSIETSYENRKESLSDYLKQVKLLDEMVQDRKEKKIRRKTDQEKDLEAKIKVLKEEHFKKESKESVEASDNVSVVLPYLYRYYKPENIELSEEGSIEAIYINKIITSTGKTQNLFLKINGSVMMKKEDWEKVKSPLLD